ncbi:TPA: hypothetical protein ACT2IF_000884 [Streptococcus suis]|uniref:hypothetical protein n=1 Tax=Streptococcus suis TaxID=1307 RepID=UPI001F064232|nr:hypothetical protein [Streptococcus suis]MCH1644387.1 hypothetical protein [Streptococcus suis]HEL1616948.1 hypothetical protein [Streptococcus suis]HEL2309188.1 hypothetical protein [Streptococcus suis]HEM3939589.1 hypothetical protein [Streptococcus suis]HEM3947501.1 hypothetical protein [Streptococcus suis]
MPYIKIEDLEIEETDTDFVEQAINKAEQLFEVVTRRFYSRIDFESDVEWRKRAVRDALIAQVGYFIDLGALTAQELNSEPETVSLGRTSIGKSKPSQNTNTSNLLCDEFYLYLSGTGLLYRGAGYG